MQLNWNIFFVGSEVWVYHPPQKATQIQWERWRDRKSQLQPFVDHSGFAVEPSENLKMTGQPGPPVNVTPPVEGVNKAPYGWKTQWLYN